MTRTRAIVALLALAAALGGPALGDETNRRALAERAVKAGYEHDVAERLMQVFWPVALEEIKERAPDATAMQLFQYEGKTQGFVDEAAHDGLVPLVDLFERGFTEDELQAIVTFYESPAGQKVLGAQGEIAAVLSGAAGESLMAEVNALARRVDDLLAADGY